jgi:predicted YcjX-like family ATPase
MHSLHNVNHSRFKYYITYMVTGYSNQKINKWIQYISHRYLIQDLNIREETLNDMKYIWSVPLQNIKWQTMHHVQLVLQILIAKIMPNLPSLMQQEHIIIFFLQFNILKWQEIAKAWKCSEKRRNDNFTWMFWK